MGYLEDKEQEEKRNKVHKFILENIFRSPVVSFNDDGDYDIQLKNGTTIEIKDDLKAVKTNNIAIETKGNYGTPSGINRTKSNYWAHFARVELNKWKLFLFDTNELKELIKDYPRLNGYEGSEIAIIPIDTLKNYKAASFNLSKNRLSHLAIKIINNEELFF